MPRAAADRQELPSPRSVRLLLVEDDEDDYLLTRDLLAEIPGQRFDLEWATTYEAGVAALHRDQYDVYLCDYRLGQHNGLEFLTAALELGCQAPVILLTGQGQREVDLEAMKAGAADYLVKGQIDAALLERSIRYALERKRYQDALRQMNADLEVRVQERTVALEEANQELRREVEQRTRAESLVAEQKRILELMVRGISLTEVLEALCETLEAQTDREIIATILLAEDGIYLRPVAGRRCPPEYAAAINPLPIGPGFGCCGTAAYRREPVIVTDIATDALWTDFRELALRHGLQACWSTPILSSTGQVLGTFAIYQHFPGQPSANDLRQVEILTRTAGIAIERQRADEALRESRERLDAALVASHTGTFRWNLRTNDLDWDENLDRLFGLPPGQTARSLEQFIRLIHPEDRAAVREQCRRCATEGADFDLDFRVIWPAGTVRWLSDRGKTIKDAEGKPLYMTGACVDITERKQAQDSLRESEERFHVMADNLPQLAWMARPDGHIFWYNQRWYEYTGTTPAEMEGWGWQAVHDSKELPRVVEKIKAHFASGQPWEDTFPLRRHDGEYRWHLSRMVPIRDEAGRIIRWFGTNTDITERLQMENLLRQADRQKDEFLATLAHELRNPLAPLRNGLELIRLSNHNSTVVEQTRAMMERQLNQLVRLVDDLLDLSRITRGKIELRKERLELAQVVENAVETSRPLVEAGGHELTVSGPPAALFVEGDLTRLAQVVANLLNNAAKYTPAGGRIWCTIARENDTGVIRVRDNGIGIPSAMLPLVFEMFRQVDNSLQRAQGGLGIGLTLVKRLTEMHGGTVEAHSAGPNQGSEFVVRLPLLALGEVLDASTGNGCSGDLAGRPRRILVVDDNADAGASLALLLRLTGNEVRTAHDGPSAIETAAAFRPDVVLLDIGMPGMDGYETGRRIKQLPRLDNVVLIAQTGWGQEQDRRRSREAGFNAHLVKPLDLTALQELLESVQGGVG